MSQKAAAVMNLENELKGLDLRDARRNRRHLSIVNEVAANPDASFPDLASNDAELAAIYRHFNNPKVTLQRCLEPHAAATATRCAQERLILSAHDTSEAAFPGDKRSGLGPLSGADRGFFVHVSLAMSADGLRRPLGVLAVDTWVRAEPEPPEPRSKKPRGKKSRSRKSRGGAGRYDDPTKESMCWRRNIDACEKRLEGKASTIHLLDRGGDSYDLLAHLSQLRFVVRANHDRNVYDPGTQEVLAKLRAVSASAPLLLEREVVLSERLSKDGPKANRTHPPRRRRMAKLEVRATRVTLQRPRRWSEDLPPYLQLNLVHVTERDCPEGEEPVEWLLYTSEPIGTAEEVAFVVDCYRARWLIEEYFKALKTGCSLEKRQLESLHALLNVLGTFVPIAWRLLLLRQVADVQPEAPATVALTPRQLEVLRTVRKKEALPALPTILQALMAIARLGGHLKHNGRPGWLVLGRGYEKLMAYEIGWVAARSPP